MSANTACVAQAFRPANGRRAALKGCATAAAILVSIVAAGTVRTLGQQQTAISFTRTIYPIFEAAQCRGCHSDDGVASATRLHFPEPNASPDDIDAFGITLAALVDRSDPSKSLLLNKPTNRERHT